MKRQIAQSWKAQIVVGSGALLWAISSVPAFANCSTPVGSVDWYQPAMDSHFEQFQSSSTHPWGNTQVVDRFIDETFFLTAEFETLEAEAKGQVLDGLLSFNMDDYLTPEEIEYKYSNEGMSEGIGTPPFEIVASDGREISSVYDGCTRFTLLTELDRFEWYYNTEGSNPETSSEGPLRNAGQPSWRQVNFPIEASVEKSVRLGFWNSVCYVMDYTDYGWWIAWVPEHGYFEVNVPKNFDYSRLQRYWEVADRDYDYVVVRADGEELGRKQF